MPADIKINLHPVNFIILSGILQCIILGIILLLYRKGKRTSNCLIGLFILLCSLHFAWNLVIDTNLGDVFKQLFWFPYSYLLALGPLIYFYTKSLTQHDFKFGSAGLTHFVPVVVELFVQLYFIREGIAGDKVHYDITGFIEFRIVQLAAAAISIIVYGKNSLKLIRQHEAAMAENFSNQRDVTLSWLYRLVKYLRLLWIFWLVFDVSFILFLQFQMHFLSIYMVLYTLLGLATYSTYWIGMQAFVKAGVLIEMVPAQVPPEKSNVYSRLAESDLKNYAEALNTLLQKERLYLHETLSLRILAQRLNIEPNLVSHVLNSVLHKSFYDYVNEFRIEEVKRKIEDPAYRHLKIVEVAYECGFNSKATFNRVFKKLTGKSPSDFRKEPT
jgi:AraC-like DNA-binding protein